MPQINKLLGSFLFLTITIVSYAQQIPSDRLVNWNIAGLHDTTTANFDYIDLATFGLDDTGILPSDQIVDSLLSGVYQNGVILQFPVGTFLFNNALQVPSNCVIRGLGAEATVFKIDLGGSGNGFNISGQPVNADTTFLMFEADKDSNKIIVFDASIFSVGDWIKISQQDADLVTSNWAIGSVGQIVQVSFIDGNTIYLASPLRMKYELARQPMIKRLVMKRNVGFECFSIIRMDNTAPEQSKNISFQYAENCWVNGIESTNCTFAHIVAENSSNLQVEKSYLHHSFEYGGGGRGYGVVLQFTSNECRVENTIFERLRHSMLLQAGVNGNVFAFNYSSDPFWTNGNPFLSGNSAGEITLHGNYVYANLFEHNCVQNIVIDNSHGANGPNNTFFRNRASLYGIFFSDNTSPQQNIVGNEIPNTSFPYSSVNYSIQGSSHFIFGNNNKGNVDPPGTAGLTDTSYSYFSKPSYVQSYQWAKIGLPNSMNSADIPAKDRFDANQLFAGACSFDDFYLSQNEQAEMSFNYYPNPSNGQLSIACSESDLNEKLVILSLCGEIVYVDLLRETNKTIDLTSLKTGVYLVLFKNKGYKLLLTN